ncbi:MAG: glutaredoxin domain-containing protein [Candidatus Woesebacteria bacterium]
MKKITVYTTEMCPYCHMLTRWLKDKNIEFTEYRVDVNPIAAQKMVQISGQMGVPFTTIEDSKNDKAEIIKVLGFDVHTLQKVL